MKTQNPLEVERGQWSKPLVKKNLDPLQVPIHGLMLPGVQTREEVTWNQQIKGIP